MYLSYDLQTQSTITVIRLDLHNIIKLLQNLQFIVEGIS